MNTSTVIAAAVTTASVALHIDTILYWIGPAGCVILIPALIIILALPLLGEESWLIKAKPKKNMMALTEVPEVLTAVPLSSETGSSISVP